MTILETLKQESLRIRKENFRNPLSSFSVFVISEIEKIGKNSGNRVTTESEVIQYIKKQIQKSQETLSFVNDQSSVELIQQEIKFLEKLLPSMASDEQIIDFLETLDISSMNKGQVMGEVKKKFGVLVDMKSVGIILKEKYNI
jgi:uncharacterized protein YqeY